MAEKIIVNIEDDSGEVAPYELVVYAEYDSRFDVEVFRTLTGILLAIGAKVKGINDIADLYEIDDVETLMNLYIEADHALPEGYLTFVNPMFGTFYVFRKLTD